MKDLLKYILPILFAVGFLLTQNIAAAQTTVWIVRHAEKDAKAPGQPLTKEGQQRANDLLKRLEREKIAAVWTTDFLRTRQTAEPTARHFNLTPGIYMDFHAVADTILEKYKNKSVLIVGHSNTLMPAVVALGAAKPIDILEEEDYDMLFKVTIARDGHVTVTANYYGSSHHVTSIPANYIR